MKEAEKIPSQVGCDIHPWMQAWWLIIRPSYSAVTDEKGNFEIENLPVGRTRIPRLAGKGRLLGSGPYKITIKGGRKQAAPDQGSTLTIFDKK